MESKLVSLDTINNGAVIDLFNEEFEKLLMNISDDNTQPDKQRSISITLRVKPSKDRSKADTTVEVKSNLAPLKPNESFIVFSSDGRRVQAFTTSPAKEQTLPGIDENVRAFPATGTGGSK